MENREVRLSQPNWTNTFYCSAIFPALLRTIHETARTNTNKFSDISCDFVDRVSGLVNEPRVDNENIDTTRFLSGSLLSKVVIDFGIHVSPE